MGTELSWNFDMKLLRTPKDYLVQVFENPRDLYTSSGQKANLGVSVYRVLDPHPAVSLGNGVNHVQLVGYVGLRVDLETAVSVQALNDGIQALIESSSKGIKSGPSILA